MSQAEHGADSQVILITDSDELIREVQEQIETQLSALPRAAIARLALEHARLILVETLDTAFAISNDYAPEHLILALREPASRLGDVRCAGSVFLGDYAPESLGDYCSGTNHVLPTNGAARAYSGVSVASFQTSISIQSVTREGLAADRPLRGDAGARRRTGSACASRVAPAGADGMNGVLDLLRPDLRDFAGYASARRATVTAASGSTPTNRRVPSLADRGQIAQSLPGTPADAAARAHGATVWGSRRTTDGRPAAAMKASTCWCAHSAAPGSTPC